MLFSRFRTAALGTAFLFIAPVLAQAQEQTRYTNDRFGTSASFPSDAFPDPLPAPVEGDGFGWTSPEGAEIVIYARQNSGNETPRSVIAARAASDTVTYDRAGERWAVVSGYRDDRIFYERYIFRGDLIHSVAIRYPQDQRSRYDPLVGPVTMTLRGPSSERG